MPETSDAEADGTFGQFIGCSALVLGLLALVGGLIWLVIHLLSGGGELARLPLSTTPQEASFSLEEDAIVEVWADLDLLHEGISPRSSNESLPHVMDYVVEIRQGEAVVVAARRCNPFESNVAKSSGTYNSIGKPSGRFYDGRIRGCSFRLVAGSYSVRANLEWLDKDDRLTFRTTELVLRQD